MRSIQLLPALILAAALEAPLAHANDVTTDDNASPARDAGSASSAPARDAGSASSASAPATWLSPDNIREVVLANLGDVARCHQLGLRFDPYLSGQVVVRFRVGSRGEVLSSEVRESTIRRASVARCIATAVRRWHFAPVQGGGIVTVNYPFNLRPPE
jgi:TonB family protein